MGKAITVNGGNGNKYSRLHARLYLYSRPEQIMGKLYLTKSGCNLFQLATRKGEQVATATN